MPGRTADFSLCPIKRWPADLTDRSLRYFGNPPLELSNKAQDFNGSF